MNNINQRCGFVSVIGLPNAGKSTLVNAVVGTKVAIVSKKVQTTRARLLGISVHANTQIILIDTPGIFKPKKTLEKAMVKAALSSFEDGDFIIHIVDTTKKDPLSVNEDIIRALEGKENVILVLNKVDQVSKPDLLQMSAKFNARFPYVATFMVSAIDAGGVPALIKYLEENLPEGDWIFPEDQMTDIPMRLLAAEITREQIFRQLHDELPYAIFVETESWEDFDNGSVKISQVVFVEKESQKSIVLGKGGSRIKMIGQKAREELEEILGHRVHLKIFVKQQEKWSERAENYRLMGLDFPA